MALVPYRGDQGRRRNSAMESLPSDVMSKVLNYVDLSTRIRLSGCNNVMRQLVYQQCTSLWVHIDFGEGTERQKQLLTDTMLASLLVSVSAKYITKSITVFSAPNVRGFGLAPLSMSRVLETVRLGDEGKFLDTEKSVIPILHTMIPFNLRRVRIARHSWEPPCQKVDTFLRELGVAERKRAQERRVLCSGCKEGVVGESVQLIPKRTGPPSLRCDTCANHFCRRGSCPIGIVDCKDCGETSCDTCSMLKRCSDCASSFCGSCSEITYCNECSNGYCDHCLDAYFCCTCEKILCERCNELLGQNIRWCEGCEKEYCPECRQAQWCDWCENRWCSECAEVKVCDHCDGTLCTRCCGPIVMKCCGKTVYLHPDECKWEGVYECECCKGNFCKDGCSKAYFCTGCEQELCEGCRERVFFDCCGESKCMVCVNTRTNNRKQSLCSVCNEKPVCLTHASAVKCQEICGNLICKDCNASLKYDCCSKVLCSDCREEYTFKCGKVLCYECDERSGSACDSCNESFCGLFHCKTCPNVTYCDSCGHSTCERCLGESKGCTCPDESPKKKARLTKKSRS